MSFILDALRKSEHERRMETAPDIMHAPAAIPRQSVPLWTVLLISALVAALVAVSVFSYFRNTTPGSSAAPAAVAMPAPPATTQPAQPLSADVAAPAPVQPAPAQPAANTQLQPPADAAVTQSSSEPVIAGAAPLQERSPVPVATVPQINAADLPGYAAIIAEGVDAGVLQMQLHVHSTSAANRFVVINGARRREGERLSEGPIVDQIVAEGAVLSYQGRRFLLSPN